MRIYGKWGGNPNGTRENPDRCIEEVRPDWVSQQCSRKRGHGPDRNYCKQHAKRYDKNETE